MTTSTDVPYRLPVGLNGTAYLVDVEKYQRSTLPITRHINDNSVEPGEQTITAEGLWRRSQEDWSDGAGQEHFDSLPVNQLTDRLRTRFYTSWGVDPFTRDGRLTMCHATEQKLALSSIVQVLAVGARLYYHNGTDVKYTDDPTVASPTWDTLGAGGTAPTFIATDGSTIFIACANGTIRSAAVASTTTAALTTTPLGGSLTLVKYCNGRLIFAYGASLYEQNRDGTTTLIGANKNTSFVWTDIAGAPNAIYACGKAGDHGEIYSIDLNTGTGALNAPVFAAGLPRGETPNALSSYAGTFAIATSLGVRVADLATGDTILYGPVIDFYGESKCLDPYGKFMQFGITALAQPSTAQQITDFTVNNRYTSGVARLNLSRFTESLVPAFCADVQQPPTATSATGACLSIATTTNGQRYFAVAGDGVYGETTKYPTDGWINVGFIRFGTIEPKVLTGIDWRHDLISGASGGVTVYARSVTNQVQFLANATVSGFGTDPQDIGVPLGTPQLGELVMALVKLTSASPFTSAPVVRRWGMKAFVAPQRMDEIVLPIVMKSEVETFNDSVEYYNTRDEFNALKALELAGTVVDYQEGDTTIKVKVDRVQLQPEKWTARVGDHIHFDGMLIVRLLTVPV